MILDIYNQPEFEVPRIPRDTSVTEYNAPILINTNHPCDRIFIQLLPADGGIVLASTEITVNNTEFVTFDNGKLRIDALGVITTFFGRTTGTYILDIAGYRHGIYTLELESFNGEGDGEASTIVDFTSIENMSVENINLSSVIVTEISPSRQEIRVKASPGTDISFEQFQLNNKPGVMPNERYWKYASPNLHDPSGQTVYYSETYEQSDYNFNNDHIFTSEAEYFAHREARGYPEDYTGLQVRNVQHEQVGTYTRPVSTTRLWPCILSFTNTSRPDERNLFATMNWISHVVESKNNLNETVYTDTIIFRTPQEIPNIVQVGAKLQILQEVFQAYQVPLDIDIQDEVIVEYGELRGPNLKVDVNERSGHDTILKSFNDLVGTNSRVRNRIINTVISGSDAIEQNYDFRSYSNFCHFSSAEERVRNFKYKITQIENFVSKSNAVSTNLVGLSEAAAASSSVFVQNKQHYDSKAENIKVSFDQYEKYLYYTSHSYEVIDNIIYQPATWPKSTSEKVGGEYNLFSVTSSEAISWFNTQITSASLYDQENTSILRNVIPTHIKADTENDQYQLFFDMVGQHFDTLFYDIQALENTHERNEDIDVGISKELIYDLAKSFGWTLQSGFDTSELWSTLLGTDSEGVYQASGSSETLTYVKKESKSHKDIEYQTWKRIVNNLPFLLKTKGTSRGLRALIATYGIPDTILRIQEYGGPTPNSSANMRALTKFNYAVDFSGSAHVQTAHNAIDYDGPTTTLSTPGAANRFLSMYEFRIDTAVTESMHLVSSDEEAPGGERWLVYLEHSSSYAGWDSPSAIAAGSASAYATYGRVSAYLSGSAANPAMSCSTDYAPFYDNDWWNISFGFSEIPIGGNFEIRYAKAAEHSNGRITHSGSAATATVTSTNSGMWRNTQKFRWGGSGSSGQAGSDFSSLKPYSGSMQEIRGWAEYLSDDTFYQHALAPTSIVGNTIESAYNDLFIRIPLGTDLLQYNVVIPGITYTFGSMNISGSIPNTNNSADNYVLNLNSSYHPKFIGWNKIPFSPKTETYYVEVPNTAGPRPTSNKIRIEDNKLRNNQLAREASFEESSFDSNPLDSDEISITLSPADQIDTDISMQFGGFSLDDYIGDPRDKFNSEYTSLRNTKNLYFKKFSRSYNVWEFIKLLNTMNKGLFKQMEAMVPARADAVVGIEIRPNLLERVKLAGHTSMSQEIQFFTASISNYTSSFNGDAQSSQQFDGSYYTNFNAPINIGVRSSQQNATSSITYMDRFLEGSEYEGVSFAEATLSAAQVYVSSSKLLSGGDDYKYVPTFNIFFRPGAFTAPVSQSVTGSAAKVISNIYPKSIDVNQQYFSSHAQRRLVIDGCKMTSPDFNAPSQNTIDGGPVAEFQLVNPNIIVVDPAPGLNRPDAIDSFGNAVSPIGSGPNNTAGPASPAQTIIVR